MQQLFEGQEEQGSIDLTLKDGDRFIVVSDAQVPFEDKLLLRSIYGEFTTYFSPKKGNFHLFLAGDIMDNFSLSKFPPRVTSNFTIKEEIELTKTYLKEWGKRFDYKHYAFGNHEDRWDREMYDGKMAPYIVPLKDVLELDKLGYDYVPYLRHYNVNGFVITHGDLIRENTAKAMLDTYSSSGCSGHVNRPHDYTRADARDGIPNTWTVPGMTCRTDIGNYIKDWRKIMPWQQGFGIGEVHGGKVYFQNVRVHHGSYYAAGRIFTI